MANTTHRKSGPKFGIRMALLASAAVMSVTFTAGVTSAAPRAEVSYAKAQKALSKGKTTKAINYAEAAVQAEPRNASYRALLGKAYLEAGRYNSAATSFNDALELGDGDPRTVLSYALTTTAIGGGKNALDALAKYGNVMDPADLGLALALAGNAERGVFVLTNTLRAGQNSAKVRQNLAYTYALAGNWRAARVMAAEDVPADQLDERLSQWASQAKPEDHMVRVASLLGISPAGDSGVPTALALSNFPSGEQMMADAKAAAPKQKAPAQVAAAPSASNTIKAPVAKPAAAKTFAKPIAKTTAKAMPAVQPVPKATAPVVATAKAPAPKRVAASSAASKTVATARTSSKSVRPAQPTGPTFVSRPVTQKLPAANTAPQRVAAAPKKAAQKAPKPAPEKVTPKKVAKAPKGDSHMVQLGSYDSEAEAKAGWNSLTRKFGDLASHDVVITKAQVKGKTYYRIAAAGFGRVGASQMCSTVRSSGRGCFAYTVKNPPKGAVGKGVRIAAASR